MPSSGPSSPVVEHARPVTVRTRTWQLLETADAGDRASQAVDVVLLVLIALNVIAVVLETVAAVEARLGGVFRGFELFSVAVFTLEYAARVWSSVEDPRYAGAVRGRLRFMRTPMALVDAAAVAPFYLVFLGFDLRIVRLLRLTRFFRVAKLGRYVETLRLFAGVFRTRREELVITTCLMGALVLLGASLVYFAENRVQPEAFASIPATMWWAIATLTTVGYGDVVPVTGLGRLLGAFTAVLGLGLFALPTAILGSGFIEAIEARKAPPCCRHCGKEL
jgi:voltage-gated potassium channel